MLPPQTKAVMTPFMLLLLLMVNSFRTYSQDTTYKKDNRNWIVNAQEMTVKYAGKDARLYYVEMAFPFKKNEVVYIPQYGYARKGDDISFFSNTPLVAIKNMDKLSILKQLSFDNTVENMGAAGIDIPAQEDFPASYLENSLHDEVSFEQKMRKVLGAYFRTGFQRMEKSSLAMVITPYVNLDMGKNNPINGQMAILLTYSYKNNTLNTYHIQMLARESRSHDPKWRDAGDEVMKKATVLFNEINMKLSQ